MPAVMENRLVGSQWEESLLLGTGFALYKSRLVTLYSSSLEDRYFERAAEILLGRENCRVISRFTVYRGYRYCLVFSFSDSSRDARFKPCGIGLI